MAGLCALLCCAKGRKGAGRVGQALACHLATCRRLKPALPCPRLKPGLAARLRPAGAQRIISPQGPAKVGAKCPMHSFAQRGCGCAATTRRRRLVARATRVTEV